MTSRGGGKRDKETLYSSVSFENELLARRDLRDLWESCVGVSRKKIL